MNVKSIDGADFHDDATGPHKGPFSAISAWFSAMNEGITLAGQYKDLTARGMSPDLAVRKVFDQIKR
mgnify:CR=1 FL=1